jgi:hypothetical protein
MHEYLLVEEECEALVSSQVLEPLNLWLTVRERDVVEKRLLLPDSWLV